VNLALILANLPAALKTADDVSALITKIAEVARDNGIAIDNAHLDAALADAISRRDKERAG